MTIRATFRGVQDHAFRYAAALGLQPRMRVQSKGCGFFGDLFMTVNALKFASDNQLSGKIDWGTSSLYYDAQAGANVWEYYFQSSSFGSAPSSSGGMVLPYRPPATDPSTFPGQTPRQTVNTLLHAHARLRPEIESMIDAVADRKSLGNTLGLHIRRTDALAGNEARRAVPLEAYVEEADSWLANHPDAGIYLATDDARTLEYFEARYGARVLWQDCVRSADGRSIHGHYDAGTTGRGFDKGLQVLCDGILLSRCNHLICGHSRVSLFALCMNTDLTFCSLEVKLRHLNRAPWMV